MLIIVLVDDNIQFHKTLGHLLKSSAVWKYQPEFLCFADPQSALDYFSTERFIKHRTAHIVILDGHLESNLTNKNAITGPDIAIKIAHEDNKKLIVSFSNCADMTARFSKILGEEHAILKKPLSYRDVIEKIVPLAQGIMNPVQASVSHYPNAFAQNNFL